MPTRGSDQSLTNLELTPGVKKVNSAIYRINLYPEGSLFQSPRRWGEQIEKMCKKPRVDWGEKVRWIFPPFFARSH